MSEKINYTNYWIFICNPKKWKIDEFLEDLENGKNNRFDSWTIPKWQYDFFRANQYGVIRVGNDKRTKKELNGKPKLHAGVYAIVKVLSYPQLKSKKYGYDDVYNADKGSSYLKSEYCVEIEYICNLISKPLTFDYLKQFKEITDDKYLIPGFQSATIPLGANAFQKLVKLSNINITDNTDCTDIQNIEGILNNITETEKEAIVKVRIGQSKIRQALISKECKCKICGLDDEIFLIASHIKPWSKSSDFEKCDLDNLFLLCPHHDALFDKGYISFDDNGKIIVSKSISETTKILMNINENIKIEINERNRIYLEWHRYNMNK